MNFLSIKRLFIVFIFTSIGISQSVEIIRDTDGIPHILGETVKDCGFGLTIAMFQDHPKMLVENILTTRGEMAQHYGQNYINQDLFIRSVIPDVKDQQYILDQINKGLKNKFSYLDPLCENESKKK